MVAIPSIFFMRVSLVCLEEFTPYPLERKIPALFKGVVRLGIKFLPTPIHHTPNSHEEQRYGDEKEGQGSETDLPSGHINELIDENKRDDEGELGLGQSKEEGEENRNQKT